VVRTDRSEPPFRDEDGPTMVKLREILLTYTFYNFDLGARD
jgi:TBC1 domain family member 15